MLASRVYSQISEHEQYGGVVPEIAARAHLEKITPTVRLALDDAGLTPEAVDLIAFTRGPGLLGPLLVGASFARALARSLGKPAMGVNHLEGHLGSAYLEDPSLKPPFLCLVVSGGHTEFVRVDEGFRYTLLGKTRDDAAGEAFDKCGKILGLEYPAGPVLAKLAASGKRNFVEFPRALEERDNFEFSYSGLKTAALRYTQSKDKDFLQANLSHICASVETAIVEVLVKKSVQALLFHRLETLTVVGGVSANEYLRKRMREESEKRGFRVIFPSQRFSGDNGVMIAAIAGMKLASGAGEFPVDVSPSLRWA